MKKEISGVIIYYYKVCHRKLWYFYNQIQMEQSNDNVQLGKLIDESAYEREDKHINIDNVINVDFIRSSGVLHEIKKSKKIEEASVFQVKYYLYYLEQRGVSGIKGMIDYPMLKKTLEICLEEKDKIEIMAALTEIEKIVADKLPPCLVRKNICKACAYFDLCFI